MTYDSQHVAMLAPGTILHHYRIGSTIGEGAMGVVYEGLDTRLQRPVAVKVLPLDNVADPARKDRFAQEAQAVSALNHPNIVTIHDVGSDPLGDGDREMAREGRMARLRS
jgi:eukaryotic-like serine/threonine-protein kinase